MSEDIPQMPPPSEPKAGVDPWDKRIEARFNRFSQKKDAQFEAIMTAIAEWKQSELNNVLALIALSERVAVLESASVARKATARTTN